MRSPPCLDERPDLHRGPPGRAPGGGVGGRAAVDDEAVDGQGRRERGLPPARQAGEAGEVRAHAEAVGRDAVLEPHDTPERGGDQDALGGPGAGGGVERREVEVLVEDARVDLGGGGGGRAAQRRVALELGQEARADPEARQAVLRRAAPEPLDGVEQPLALRGELGMGERPEVEGRAAGRGGLPLGGRQEEEHGGAR